MKKKIFYIVLTMIVSSAVVIGLFVSSEHIMKRENPFVPCSCGGVLEKMGWWEHLWFNGIVCILTVTVIITDSDTQSSFVTKRSKSLFS